MNEFPDFFPKEKEILRSLAANKAEIAALPIQKKKQ